MTRAINGDLLKGNNDAHIRSHLHLTNCIHMHCHSTMIHAERSLIRDLIALQRSRSLRDPSTTPLSCLSPSAVGLSNKKHKKHEGGQSWGRSIDAFQGTEIGQPSTVRVPNDQNVRIGIKDVGSSKGAEPKETKHKTPGGFSQQKVEARDRKKCRGSAPEQNVHRKTLLEHLEKVPLQTDNKDQKISHICQQRSRNGKEKLYKEAEASGHGHHSGLSKFTDHKFRGWRKAQSSTNHGAAEHLYDMFSTSSSVPKASRHQKGYIFQEKKPEVADKDVPTHPANGCGIPWNWSRVHQRGKTFLDTAGKSLPCGLSDSRQRRKYKSTVAQVKAEMLNMPLAIPSLSSSADSDSESLPLFIEPSESHESTENSFLERVYPRELGISLHQQGSDFGSEVGQHVEHLYGGLYSGRHCSLTEKYMPRTFSDLVGQHMIVQALSNAVTRRSFGFAYVFYGPQGTGKTSCARVFAKALTCQSNEGPKPCDVCNSCISHNRGKSQYVLEFGLLGNFDAGSIIDVLDNGMPFPLSSQYRVIIFDDCDSLPSDSWKAILNVIDQAPRYLVFIFVCSVIDHFPHAIISRCHKFFFPKLKESDILHTLRLISISEGLEIDNEALKLIASRADGSLRDAEMTLDQLCLLGQRISLLVVQELVGLVSNDKLVDLLDLAFSSDTVNTIKSVREIVETGVDPLALMSQLATVITDILAGSRVSSQGRVQRKFFDGNSVSKEDVNKLCQALQTLSESEKQMRASNDKITWLTASLLQLASCEQFNSQSSPCYSRSDQCPANIHELGVPQLSSNRKNKQAFIDRLKVWRGVLEKIQSKSLREFMCKEGNLISVSSGAVPIVKLAFSSRVNKSRAEKFRHEILQAFKSVVHSGVRLDIRCEARNNINREIQVSSTLPTSGYSSSQTEPRQLSNQTSPHLGSDNGGRLSKEYITGGIGSSPCRWSHSDPFDVGKGEITEILSSPQGHGHIDFDLKTKLKETEWHGIYVGDAVSSQGRRVNDEHNQSRSLVRGKTSLAEIIQQAEGCIRQGGRPRFKPVSIAEKLERENLRLEPRSRILSCWRSSRFSRRKIQCLRIRKMKPCSLMNDFLFGRCLPARSSRRRAKEKSVLHVDTQ